MKLLLLHSVLFASLFLVIPFTGVESSPPTSWNDTRNITKGSSIATSPNDTGYWLSPSGNIAFGFYKLPCSRRSSSSYNCSDRYVVGIWFFNSSKKTLVWTANRNHLPLSKPSSVLFTSQGKLVLRVHSDDNKDKPLIPDLQEPISYAKMHDDGNFVLYGTDSQIIWESFDYPTDTILGRQRLKDGVDLISSVSDLSDPGSGEYKLSIRQTDGFVAIHKFSDGKNPQVISEGLAGSTTMRSPVTLNLDNNTGNLFLVDSDGVVLQKLYENNLQQPTQQQQDGIYIYRATLDSKGNFNLCKERIDGATDKSLPLWSSLKQWTLFHRISYGLLCAFGIALAVYVSCMLYVDAQRLHFRGDLELGKK